MKRESSPDRGGVLRSVGVGVGGGWGMANHTRGVILGSDASDLCVEVPLQEAPALLLGADRDARLGLGDP